MTVSSQRFRQDGKGEEGQAGICAEVCSHVTIGQRAHHCEETEVLVKVVEGACKTERQRFELSSST